MADFRVVLLTFAALIFCFFGCWFIDLALSTRKMIHCAGYAFCVVTCMLVCVLIGAKAINHYKCNAGDCINVKIIGLI